MCVRESERERKRERDDNENDDVHEVLLCVDIQQLLSANIIITCITELTPNKTIVLLLFSGPFNRKRYFYQRVRRNIFLIFENNFNNKF